MLLIYLAASSTSAINFAAGTPVLAAKTQRAGEYVFFPQTLRRVTGMPDTLVMSYQSDADELHDYGWTGGLLGSTDGATWHAIPQPHSPMLVKSCFEPDDQSLKCYEYPLQKLATNSSDVTHARLGWQLYTAKTSAPGGFVQTSAGEAPVTFPADKHLKSWGDNTFLMVTDGKVLSMPLPGVHQQERLLLLYGHYVNSSKYALVATHSTDEGATWTYLSDVSYGAPSPCDNPSEHDCTWMADLQTILCVWRSGGTAKTLCESRTSDNGRTWTPAQPLRGSSEEQPGDGTIPSAPIGVEPKLERLNNGLLVVSAGRPGLYLWAAVDPTAQGVPGSSGAALTWQGFNIAAHHNAAVTDPSLKYSSDTPSSSETTSYTGMVHILASESGVVVSYDRLANGWSPAPYPPPASGGKGLSALFTVRVNISKA
tara:strand:- start:5271 stop:6548 length:1278 start_codon:yes stop_codon:yes gene_type:complete